MMADIEHLTVKYNTFILHIFAAWTSLSSPAEKESPETSGHPA